MSPSSKLRLKDENIRKNSRHSSVSLSSNNTSAVASIKLKNPPKNVLKFVEILKRYYC